MKEASNDLSLLETILVSCCSFLLCCFFFYKSNRAPARRPSGAGSLEKKTGEEDKEKTALLGRQE